MVSNVLSLLCFNPRSHTGSDQIRKNLRFFNKVSIHAPTRGATGCEDASYLSLKFQSTLPHGERQNVGRFVPMSEMFQSTLPHGERLVFVYTLSWDVPFQSTLPHGERRKMAIDKSNRLKVSIHAPTRGATELSAVGCRRRMFQSTLPHGERLISGASR